MRQNYTGFTLAEVLITLAVIGVVAAMSIPSLVNSTNNEENTAAIKKDVASFNQAVILLGADNGGDIKGLFSASGGAGEFLDKLCTKLNCTKKCYRTDDATHYDGNNAWGDCFITSFKDPRGNVLGRSDAEGPYANGLKLANGANIIFAGYNGWSSDCATDRNMPDAALYIHGCAPVVIDVNGNKGPNTIGKDIYGFALINNGLAPPENYPWGGEELRADNMRSYGYDCYSKALQGTPCK